MIWMTGIHVSAWMTGSHVSAWMTDSHVSAWMTGSHVSAWMTGSHVSAHCEVSIYGPLSWRASTIKIRLGVTGKSVLFFLAMIYLIKLLNKR